MTDLEKKSAPVARKEVVEEAKASPTAAFDAPADVVADDGLTKKEKVGILVQWEADAIALQTATDEGMTGGKRPRLEEVKSAQTHLEAAPATISKGGVAEKKRGKK